jgi:hypothetical protein
MSLRADAEYMAFIKFFRILPLNDDKTIPTTERVIGGAGPFDFSAAYDTSAVEITFKQDGTAETIEFDVSTGVGSVDETAVTVAELFAAINDASPANVTASQDTTTNRIKLALTVPGSVGYFQVYGEGAEIAMFGQGKGVKFVKSNTVKSLTNSPNYKESEEKSTQDSNGKETTIQTDSYKKGFSSALVDSAYDPEMGEIIEGGVWNSTTGQYDDPDSESTKIYFMYEAFYAKYLKGENKEGDLVGYYKEVGRTLSGQVGDETHDYNLNDVNYSMTATNYKDENGTIYPAKYRKELSITEYAVLDVENV